MKTYFLFLTVLVLNTAAISQNISGAGNVTSTTGIAVPNAVVKIAPVSDTSIVYEYVCDKNGNYSFDFVDIDTNYVFKISPSVQTLVFDTLSENITLSAGNNGMLSHQVNLSTGKGIRFTVVDTAGNPVAGAKVVVYDTKRKWRIDSCRTIKPVYTDINGQVEVNSLLPERYWFNIKKNYLTNRFTVKDTVVDTTTITEVTVVIRDLTQNEFLLCGLCDNKTWITDSMVIFGVSQPYNADSKLLSDATWYDSNGNHGFWWFNQNETMLTYDYDSSSTNGAGSTVEATLIELTDSSFVGDMIMLGLPVTYYMSAVYDTVSLTLFVHDTVLYLDNNGLANISTEDLIIDASYCFNCDITLSRYDFDASNTGDVEVYAVMTDRCGNQAIDTFIVTIQQTASISDILRTGLNIFPNPANDFFVIKSDYDVIKSVYISTVDGRCAEYKIIDKQHCIINVSGYKPGIYFLKILTQKETVFSKLIVR